MKLDPFASPLAEFRARLGWALDHETIHAQPAWQSIRFIPEFAGCNPAVLDSNTGIVWDVLELFASAQRPGGHQVLNSDCGYPPDVGIEEPVFVSHPDAGTVVWEIDALALATALAPEWAGRAGFVRLMFERETYEHDICAMLDAIRAAGSPELPVDELEPDGRGMAFERALALDCAQLRMREPILPPNTLLEFGFSGSHLLAINGEPDRGWPVRLFPRWSVYACFQEWLRFACRGYALRYALEGMEADWSDFSTEAVWNDFFLLRESDRAACDRAGEALARSLKAAFDEGGAAPGVEVVYRPCACRAVLE